MKYLFGLIILFTLNNVHAQTTPTFSGTWSIDTTKTNFGQAPHWILPVSFKVVQDGDKLAITRTSAEKDLKQHDYSETLTAGVTSENTLPSGYKRTATLNWNADKVSFTIHSSSISTDGKAGLKITEVWSLTDDGKTLVIDRSVEQADGFKYSIKAFYDKGN